MAKRGIDEVGIVENSNPKRQKTGEGGIDITNELIQRASIVEMAKRADAPFRIDERGDVDCALDWSTYSHPDYKKVPNRTKNRHIIQIHLTVDKIIYPTTVATFNGFVIFGN